MSPSGSARVPGWIRALGWILAPLAVAAAATYAHRAGAVAADEGRSAARNTLAELGAASVEAARAALGAPFLDAGDRIDPRLRGRVEGMAVWKDTPGAWLEWTGTPMIPPVAVLDVGDPDWTVVRIGDTVRLVAVAGPDEVGRSATATFLLDAPIDGRRLADLVSPRLRRNFDLGWSDAVDLAGLAADRDGILAALDVTPRPRPNPAAALAVLTWIGLTATAVRWSPRVREPAGWLAAVGATLAARAALLVTGLPSPPIPASWADARAYGTDVAAGALGSPADLVLSGVTAWVVLRSTASLLRARGDRHPALPRALAVLTAIGASALAIAVARSLALDARVRPFAVGGSGSGSGAAVLAIGLGLFLLAAAEPWAAAWSLRPSRRGGISRGRSSIEVGIAVILLAVLVAGALQSGYDRVAIDRLETEFAPEVLGQEIRRRAAVDSAVDWSAEALVRSGVPLDGPSLALDNLVYHLWADGPLYHAGFKSSLTVLAFDGSLLAHFGFDIPPLDERPAAGPPSRVEPFELFSTVRKRLLHRERELIVDGDARAVVVAHVLDEPDNLGFLPTPRAYLTALGPSESGGAAEPPAPWEAPEYVEYSPVGVARFHTLESPPGWTYAFDKAAIEGRTVRVEAGDSPYFGLPRVETDRLHLLLTPAPTLVDRLGTFARIALLGVALLIVVDGLRRLARRGGARAMAAAMRRSYLRKLVAALLVASVVPWVGLSLVLRANLERRGDAARENEATQLAVVAQRVIEDYIATLPDDAPVELPDDPLLYWLRRLVGQDIHLYESGELVASSKRELFDAGLVLPHLPADVNFEINQSNRPVLVRPERIGPLTVPVAYAPVRAGPASGEVVVAVPLVFHQPEIARALDRNMELMLLATLLVAGVLAAIAAPMAGAVARPVRDLVRAAGRVADGEYDTRVRPRGEDEVASLTRSFNAMVGALGRQRDDLVRRRDYMEALLENATTGVISTDPSGRIVTLNPAAAALLASEGARPRIGADLVATVAAVPSLAPLDARLRDVPAERSSEEINLVREDGSIRRLRIVRVDLPDPDGGRVGRLVLLDDVTDFMRRNQLEAWAEMARAIAHEIKNPLTPIQLSAEHLERILGDRGALPSAEIEACLGTVRKQVRALREIAAEFSAYAKVPALRPVPTRVDAFLRDVVSAYRAAPPAGIEIVERHRPSRPVAIDTRVLGRAIVNLIENALHAMPDGGTLTLASEPEGDGVRLTVADTGHGLSDEARARLFEPYFSTKSSGTGLGLAIVLRAVEGHGGRIDVAGAPGEGTAFHVHLPASAAGPSADA